ncbi:MAG: twin-arginine translocase subunit TatB [Caulobacter sp.]|nr:twin-arginine translocase subunit TatB [Caulobacter sp.]
MLPDIGGSELLIIAAVALIVVGPKDLPVLMRKIGQFLGRMRGMANEFRASFDEMARQSELDELRKEVQAMREGQYAQPFKEAADAARDVGLNQTFAEIDASLKSGAMQPYPPAAAATSAEAAPAVAEPAVEIVKPRKPRATAKATATSKASAARITKTAAPKKAPAKSKTIAVPSKRASAAKSDEVGVPPRKTTRAAAKKSDIIS